MKDYYDGKYTYWPGNSKSVTYNNSINFDLIFPTKEDTIGYAKECGEDSIYVVRLEAIPEPEFDADVLLEQLCEDYCWNNDIEECGLEDVEKEKVKELEQDLNKVFHKWLEKYNFLIPYYTFEDGEAIFFNQPNFNDIPKDTGYIN